MNFRLTPLPYAVDALEPHISRETVTVHYERHHRGYLNKLEGLIAGTPHEDRPLQEIVLDSDGATFNNAAQVWNHDFYWQSMTPDAAPLEGILLDAIVSAFGSEKDFRDAFIAEGSSLFGSGYLWLSSDPEGREVRLRALPNADNPLLHGEAPLLCMDVWEHAYYIDRRNVRKEYVETFYDHLAHWAFATDNLRKLH
jgi:Fe-Mn family superoxide dismutase